MRHKYSIDSPLEKCGLVAFDNWHWEILFSSVRNNTSPIGGQFLQPQNFFRGDLPLAPSVDGPGSIDAIASTKRKAKIRWVGSADDAKSVVLRRWRTRWVNANSGKLDLRDAIALRTRVHRQ